MKELIRLEGVWKIYKLNKNLIYALKDIDFSIKKNDFIAIIGPSGSGKSTLLHICGLLDKPTKGEVWIEGKRISKFSKDELALIRNKKIGFIFQQFNLVPYLNALQNVYLPILFSIGVDEEKIKAKAKKLLKEVGLEGKEKHKPNELSGGEQQRVAIARALIMDPPLILADEPTGNLDSKTGNQIMELLRKLHKEEERTIVVVTHDPSIITYAKKHINIKDGKLYKDHKLARIYLWKK